MTNIKGQCVLVLGVEASGTRVIKEIFMLNGYAGGNGHEERWGNNVLDYEAPDPAEFPAIVWRFSYPMGDELPRADIAGFLARKLGYELLVVIIVRDGWAGQRHGPDESRASQSPVDQVSMMLSMMWQVQMLRPEQVRIVTYESLIQRQIDVFQNLSLALPLKKCPKIIDGNEKWYKTTCDTSTSAAEPSDQKSLGQTSIA